MQGSKYNDTASILQVIGCLFKKPSLLQEDGKYFFKEEDFINDLHRVVFGALLHLNNGGADSFNAKVIEDYLQKYPNSIAIYKKNNGAEWIAEVVDAAELDNFDYNYQRMKKMTLLRAYDNIGLDVSWIYDPDNILVSVKERQRQEQEFDSLSLNDIAQKIEDKILSLHDDYIDNITDESIAIGDGLDDFIEELYKTPDMGLPLYGDLVNTVTRGCRKGKFYLRSAATGVGKSRTMMADACVLACDEFYDTGIHQWVSLGECQSTVFISTELELSEVRTMALAFLSGVNEDHILMNNFNAIDDEWNRVKHAAEVLKRAKLRIEVIPDFSLKDIENIIKRNIRMYQVQYVFKYRTV